MKKLLRYFLLTLSFLMSLASCSKSPTSKKIVNGIHLNIIQEPLTLDPRKGADYTSSTLQFFLFEGLLRMTPDSLAAPAIAERVDVSEDELTYTFHLREAKWSNGTPITAYDFSQTWLDMLDPYFPAPNAHLLFPILNAEKAKKGLVSLKDVGIHALNYNTLEINLEAPTPFFKELISCCVFSPVCQHHTQQNSDWAEAVDKDFVCNGPYRLARRKIGNEIIFEKNPYYWDADSVELEQITISIIDNETTALNMFLNNQLDMIGLPFTGIPSDAIPNLLDKGLIKTTEIPASTICCFNLNKYPFNNKNIRKAFAYSVNRKEIVDNITQTGEIPGVKLLPDSLLSNQPEPFFKDGDVETAKMYLKKGLEELGITKEQLPKLTLLHASTGIYPKVAQAIQEQWRRALDITVELNGFEYKVFLDKLGKKDYCIGQCVWIVHYYDPMSILDRFRIKENAKNYPGFDNQTYRELVDRSLFYANKEERFSELNKALDVINEEVPLTAIYHWKSPYMHKPYIKDLFVDPSGTLYLPKVKLEKDLLPSNRPSQFLINQDSYIDK
jgi:oligopeptide transport system substrate-binding protein